MTGKFAGLGLDPLSRFRVVTAFNPALFSFHADWPELVFRPIGTGPIPNLFPVGNFLTNS